MADPFRLPGTPTSTPQLAYTCLTQAVNRSKKGLDQKALTPVVALRTGGEASLLCSSQCHGLVI